MLKATFKAVLLSSLLFTSSLALADLNPEVKKNLDTLHIEKYEVVDDNPNATVIYSEDYGFLTFFDNGKQFTNNEVFYLDKNGTLVSTNAVRLKHDLEKFNGKFIDLKSTAKEKRGHLYIYFNIRCPHCHHLISEADKYQASGFDLTFIPLSDPSNADEVAKMAYILEQDPAKRFAYITKDVNDIPKSPNANMFLQKGFDLAHRYNITSYPYIVSDLGFVLKGYIPAAAITEIYDNALARDKNAKVSKDSKDSQDSKDSKDSKDTKITKDAKDSKALEEKK